MPSSDPSSDNISGSLLIGGLISMALWGVACVQIYLYFTRTSSDKLVFKATIALIGVLGTFDSVLISHFSYYYLISHDGNPLSSLTPLWTYSVHTVVISVSDFIIRTMFAYRICIFNNNKAILPTWIMLLSLTSVASELFGRTEISIGSSSRFLQDLAWLNLATAVVADLSITISLSYLLHRSRTGFRRTNSVIRLLIIYTVNTGGLVALGSLVILVACVTDGKNLIVYALFLALSKLYIISYLASLNAREAIRDRFQNDDPISINSQFLAREVGSHQSSPGNGNDPTRLGAV
ncbi:hypothetical protein BDN72DRAFT_894613 [Pluteus cervinus]|uniref:Uncharacterized protein n=1 Tax=Pluteus cervinus TaxID=181527 RepID=A0ACD3B4B8_9AGAR|nr:hypothetical protein BDN72DRAFT_894613 [Pluteus cervinus]